MNKISNAQASQLMKTAAENLRALSEDNKAKDALISEQKEKIAHFEKKAHAERIAEIMEEKGINPEVSFKDKVAGIMTRDDLKVLEEAVNLNAPQIKIASVHEDENAVVDSGPDYHGDSASNAFATGLASIGE